ncbi:MAG: hypothetical protein ACK5X3_07980 [Pseudomonadota bacterium]|jgi:hypothetical protein
MTHPGNGRAVFTPERCAALKEDWQAGVSAAAIMARLNTMPCAYPVASPQAVMDKARVLGLKRPKGWALAQKRTAAPRSYTPERRALLRRLINLIPDADLLERLNALPGPAVRNARAMRDRAQLFGYLAERPRKSGPNQGTWSEAREAFLRQNYGRISPAELLAALQAMPGPAIASIKTVRSAAVRLGIKSAGLVRQAPPPRRPAIIAAPAPAPEPEPAPLTPEEQEAAVAAAWARKHARAMELFAQGKSAEAVAASIKVPLREACRLLGEYRNQAAQRKAA